MRGRDFTKQVEVLTATEMPDGFGGFTTKLMPKFKTWADLKITSSYALNQYGMQELSGAVTVTVRPRKDHEYTTKDAIRYSGDTYAVRGVYNRDFQGEELNLICTNDGK